MRFFDRNWYIFLQENVFENVVWKMASILSRPQCVNLIVTSIYITSIIIVIVIVIVIVTVFIIIISTLLSSSLVVVVVSLFLASISIITDIIINLIHFYSFYASSCSYCYLLTVPDVKYTLSYLILSYFILSILRHCFRQSHIPIKVSVRSCGSHSYLTGVDAAMLLSRRLSRSELYLKGITMTS